MDSSEIINQLNSIKDGQHLTEKLMYYKGETRSFKVYEVDLTLLSFNPHNGRIGSIVEEYKQEHGTDIISLPIEERNSLIHDWIKNKNVARNKQTYEDIKQKQQIEPTVITSDGLVVDGNRRFMTLRTLASEGITRQIKTVILDETYDDPSAAIHIEKLETSIQLGKDPTLGYDPIEKYIKSKKFMDDYERSVLPENEIVTMMGFKSVQVLRSHVSICRLMDEYLDFIEMPKMYSVIAEQEDLFITLEKTLGSYSRGSGKSEWDVSDNDIQDFKDAAFYTLRYNYNINKDKKPCKTQDLRDNLYRNSKDTIFANQEIWKEYKQNIDLNNIDDLYTVSEQKEDISQFLSEGLSYSDAGRKVNEKWSAKVHPSIAKAINVSFDSLSILKQSTTPINLLESSLKKMLKFIDKEKFEKNGELELSNLFEHIKTDKDAYQISNNLRRITEYLKKNINI